jgi:hypothetical protein
MFVSSVIIYDNVYFSQLFENECFLFFEINKDQQGLLKRVKNVVIL